MTRITPELWTAAAAAADKLGDIPTRFLRSMLDTFVRLVGLLTPEVG